MSEMKNQNTVHDLRRRWKPIKKRLQRASSEHPLAIRLHRAFSWMSSVEDAGKHEQLDEKLIFRWIGLNSLYGRWNSCRREPESDGQSLRHFLSVVEDSDADSLIKNCLIEHKRLVISICSDQFVNDYFWRTLDTDKRFNSNRDKFSIQKMYAEERWPQILEELLGRIYLVRCQLVHGAATFDGKLNRDTVRRCGMMLELLLLTIITIIIDHAWTGNWDNLCYPPVLSLDYQSRRFPQ